MKPFKRRLLASLLNFLAPPVGHYFLGAALPGLALFALVPATFGWLIYSVYAGAETGHVQFAIGLVVLALLAVIVHPWFVRLGESPAPVRVVVTTLVLMTLSTLWPPMVRERWLEAFRIPSSSMYPGLLEGDHFFALKRPWQVARGEVVVYDDENGQTFVKRVVALSGDRVAVSDGGTVTVNGGRLPTEPSGKPCVLTSYSGDEPCERRWETLGTTRYEITRSKVYNATEFPETVVPPGTVFLLGDNRENSHDSRYTGSVPVEQLLGRAGPVWWRR